jgi:hypothetical protein
VCVAQSLVDLHFCRSRELCDQLIASHNGNPPWSKMAFVRIVHEIEHHNVVSSAIFGDDFCEEGPREWTNQALKTPEEAMESYMVEVIAKASF